MDAEARPTPTRVLFPPRSAYPRRRAGANHASAPCCDNTFDKIRGTSDRNQDLKSPLSTESTQENPDSDLGENLGPLSQEFAGPAGPTPGDSEGPGSATSSHWRRHTVQTQFIIRRQHVTAVT